MAERTLTAVIEGASPYSQSRHHETPFLEGEGHDAHGRRTWREHAHYDPQTREVYIPAMSLKLSIARAGSRLQLQKKGQSTWTADILAGVIVPENIPLGMSVDDLVEERFFANLDGRRGGKSRGMRSYPMVPAGWKGTARIIVADELIPEDIVERCLERAGSVVGLGRFRPENGGFLGRFAVKSVKWTGIGKQRAA